MDTRTKRHFLGTGHIAGSLGQDLESIAEPMPILKEGKMFCEFAGTKYNCCKKVCFNDGYCKVRDFRSKYNL